MTRDDAFALLTTHLKSESLLKHSIASEAVMRKLANHLGEDEAQWGLAGLLHDIDVDLTASDLSKHCLEAEKILTEAGVDPVIVDAIKLHNEEAHGIKRSTVFHHALAAAETITGLVTATALVYEDKKLASVKAKSVRKRYKAKAFAAGANREIIAECEMIGVPLDDFCTLALEAMQGVSDQLGL